MSECPEWLDIAVKKTMDDYDPGIKTDYSSTSLISPAMILHLKKTQGEGRAETASLLSSFYGTAIHNQIESKLKGLPQYIVEERFYTSVNGFVISCQIDLYDKVSKVLSDHKSCSVYKAEKDEQPEWEQQLNINRYIMIQNGYEVDEVKINALLLDWRRSESLRGGSYPRSKFKEIHIPLWNLDRTEEFIKQRISIHERAKQGLVSHCSPEERWAQNDSWAVFKKGAKRATRVLYSELEAQKYLEENNLDRIEYRQGLDIRCTEYCPVNNHCNYFRSKYDSAK